MSTLAGRWIEIFRAGDYGEKGKYGREDLDKIVANYDANVHQAPLVVGHPKADSPAYGWVEGLRRSGEALEAQLGQVDGDFEDLVKQGRFNKRSIALYNDLGGRGLYLRHLGFLGAQPPEVKGLRKLQFCEFCDNSGFIAVEFPDLGAAAADVAIEKLIGIAAAAGKISFEGASTLLMEVLNEFLPIHKNSQDAAPEFKFNLSPGIVVDPHSIKVLEHTEALRRKNSSLTFEEAMRQARKELGES